MGETIFTRKKKKSTKLKQNHFELSQHKTIGFINLENIEQIEFLIDGFKVLPSNFLLTINEISEELKAKIDEIENIKVVEEILEEEILGIDFILTDESFNDLKLYMEKGVTPIVSKENYLGQLLKEFDPLENTGNSFLYDSENIWSSYYALIRYLENSKFPMDNRNLIKNVSSL